MKEMPKISRSLTKYIKDRPISISTVVPPRPLSVLLGTSKILTDRRRQTLPPCTVAVWCPPIVLLSSFSFHTSPLVKSVLFSSTPISFLCPPEFLRPPCHLGLLLHGVSPGSTASLFSKVKLTFENYKRLYLALQWITKFRMTGSIECFKLLELYPVLGLLIQAYVIRVHNTVCGRYILLKTVF